MYLIYIKLAIKRNGRVIVYFSGVPVYLHSFELYEDDPDALMFPVSQLVNTSEVAINLNECGNYDPYWRVRLSSIKIILLDKDGKPVPTYGIGFGDTVNFIITYPSVFNDTNWRHEKYSFLAQHYFCPANYYTDEQGNFTIALTRVT